MASVDVVVDPAGRWESRKVVITGPSGRKTPHQAKVPPLATGPSWDVIIPIVIMIALVASSLFFPPMLLLNIPVLLARAAIHLYRTTKYEQVYLPSFECPECRRENAPAQRKGELPLDFACAHCGAKLTAGQERRTYPPDRVRPG